MESKILNFPDAMKLAHLIIPHLPQADLEDDFPKSIFGKLSTSLPPKEFADVVSLLLGVGIEEALKLHNMELVLNVSKACLINKLPLLCGMLRESK